jgi:hypothetical protein
MMSDGSWKDEDVLYTWEALMERVDSHYGFADFPIEASS